MSVARLSSSRATTRGAPVALPLRLRVEHAVDSLIALLDALDAPGEDLEPEPIENDLENEEHDGREPEEVL